MKEIFRSLPAGDKTEFAIYGRAVNGEARVVDDETTLIGQDVALALPTRDAAAVFDGAGGATDVGSPEKAALTSAKVFRDYIYEGGDDLNEALSEIRLAVESDEESGVCVGTIALVKDGKVKSLNVGDTSAFIYDTKAEDVTFAAKQQTSFGQPDNYIGRKGLYMPDIKSGSFSEFKYDDGSELYLMSDGVSGHLDQGKEMQGYHFKAAHYDYQLIQAAREQYPELEDRIQSELDKVEARQLREGQFYENTNEFDELSYDSPELEDATKFTLDRVDWGVWFEIVEPMIKRLKVEPKLGRRALLKSLVDKPIACEYERPRPDDATIVYAKLRK